MFMQYKHYDKVKVPRYVVGRTKYHGHQMGDLIDIVNEALPVFRTMLEFSDQLHVALKPMNKKLLGVYDPNTDTVEAEYRHLNPFILLSTIAHELVHAEQYYQKRFDSEWHGNGYLYKWNNTYYTIIEKDYNKYLPPWEEEAFERQDGLALAVCSELGV